MINELKIELKNIKKELDALQKYIELKEKNERLEKEVFNLLTSNTCLIDALNAYGAITEDRKGTAKLTEIIQRQVSILTFIEKSDCDMATIINIKKALENERKLAFFTYYQDWAKAQGMEE